MSTSDALGRDAIIRDARSPVPAPAQKHVIAGLMALPVVR
jgi:hypothetical protein